MTATSSRKPYAVRQTTAFRRPQPPAGSTGRSCPSTTPSGPCSTRFVLACRPRLVVELGTSGDASALYIAAAVRQQGFGRLITTEIVPEKAQRASAILARAGLNDLIELRVGDARRTLGALDDPAGLVFLDGWQDAYADVSACSSPT